MLAGLAEIGVVAEGDLGSSSPLEAMEKVLADHQFDEIEHDQVFWPCELAVNSI
jgi:hypothetical protein